MKFKRCLIAAALGVALSANVAAAEMTAAQAETLLQSKGFTDVAMLEFENGQWLATATDNNGMRVDVRLDPAVDKVTSTQITTTTTTSTEPTPAANTIIKSNTVIQEVPVIKEVPVVVETQVVVEKEVPVIVEKQVVVEKPVIVERIVEVPAVRQPIMVKERVLVPMGGKISKDDVRAVLTGAGYHDIHDIDWLSGRGVWKAEARDATGDDREIHVDPFDARIVHVEDD